MARGNNILFGRFPIKKKEIYNNVFRRSFPVRPERIARHKEGVFLVGEEELYSLKDDGSIIYRLPIKGFSRDSSLTQSGALWFDGENICYRNLYPDLFLEQQVLPREGWNLDSPLSLHLASGNEAYLLQEEVNYQGKVRANLKRLRIDPGGNTKSFWRDYFPKTKWFQIDSFQPSENEGWFFYKGQGDTGKIQQIDLLTTGSHIKQWKFPNLNESFYYPSPKLLHYKGQAIYAVESSLSALELSDSSGKIKEITSFKDSISDFSLEGDLLAILLSDGSVHKHDLLAGSTETVASLDVGKSEVLLAKGGLYVLSDNKDYLYLPSF